MGFMINWCPRKKASGSSPPAPDFRRDRVAGVQKYLLFLDSGFRRNDGKKPFATPNMLP